MRGLVTAFALGAAAVAAIALAAALAVAALAEAGGRDELRVALGPLVLVAFERTPEGTSTTFGSALALLPLLGGALNAVGAALVRGRRR